MSAGLARQIALRAKKADTETLEEKSRRQSQKADALLLGTTPAQKRATLRGSGIELDLDREDVEVAIKALPMVKPEQMESILQEFDAARQAGENELQGHNQMSSAERALADKRNVGDAHTYPLHHLRLHFNLEYETPAEAAEAIRRDIWDAGRWQCPTPNCATLNDHTNCRCEECSIAHPRYGEITNRRLAAEKSKALGSHRTFDIGEEVVTKLGRGIIKSHRSATNAFAIGGGFYEIALTWKMRNGSIAYVVARPDQIEYTSLADTMEIPPPQPTVARFFLPDLKLSAALGHFNRVLPRMLSGDSSVLTLGIVNKGLGDSGAIAVSRGLVRSSSTTHVNLSANGIAAAGAKALSQALVVNQKVSTLDLSHNLLGDAGVRELAKGIRSNHGLTELDLSNNRFGDAGASCLANAIDANDGLTSVNIVSNPAISRDGITAIKAAVRNWRRQGKSVCLWF